MGNSNTTIVEFRHVHKRFGPLEVLRGVDLDLERGKTTVIIGESGTGKSVLLKHMVGLIHPDSGEIHVNGRRVDQLGTRDLVEVRKQFGFLFQMGALFDSLTAGQNVAFPLVEHTDYDDEQIEQIVHEKLALVGLERLASRRPSELSGGQRKRVALARAIALNPSIILYDEPTTGLDPLRADTINDLIIKLKDELHVTSVVVTHDMTSAFKVADRILMLHQGQFVADGSADDFRTSTNPLVRRFVAGDADMEVETEQSTPQRDGEPAMKGTQT